MVDMACRKLWISLIWAYYFSCFVSSDFIASKQVGENVFEFTQDKTAGIVAYAEFQNAINKTGWATLEVYTNGSYPSLSQAYSAGCVEGYGTRELLALKLYNSADDLCGSAPLSQFCSRLETFLTTNLNWVYSQIDKNATQDAYWAQVALVLAQMAGISDGYNNKSGEAHYKIGNVLDPLFLIQISGDIEDLQSALGGTGSKRRILGSGSCSALIKLLPGNKDLYVSQDTWNGFGDMLRVLKKYDFAFSQTLDDKSAVVPGRAMTFSSDPGTVTSGDDYYLISTGLASLETTIGNSNTELWKYVTPEGSILEGIRSMVANRLATSGLQWSQIFAKYNSGTYNNQWMVVDYKKFTPSNPPQPGTLYVLEQIPKYLVYNDMTELLTQQTYWPSYNVPYFKEIFNMSGHADAEKAHGDWFSYNHTARANIFRRDHSKVTDLNSMIKLMRYNDFTHDELSKCNCSPPYSGENAISARSDLNPANGTYPFSALGHRAHGGTDMKVTSSELFRDLEFVSILSPTYDQVPAFQWSKSDFEASVKHLGHPDVFKFGPIQYEWSTGPFN